MDLYPRINRAIQVSLQIIDSSGSRDFLAMRHFYVRTGDAFLVSSISDLVNKLAGRQRLLHSLLCMHANNKKLPSRVDEVGSNIALSKLLPYV